jgi:hypothetical protein
LLRVLKSGDILGVSGGETVSLMAQLMPTATVDNLTVVQLGTAVAYLGERAAFSSAEAALQVAQKLASMERLVLIPVPFVVDTETIRDALGSQVARLQWSVSGQSACGRIPILGRLGHACADPLEPRRRARLGDRSFPLRTRTLRS